MIMKIDAIVREEKFEDVKNALMEIEVNGLTVSQVMGCGLQRGYKEIVRGMEVEPQMQPKVKFEIVVSSEEWAEKTIEAIKEDNEYKLIYTNLVDFDMLYGHRNNVEGYAKALEYFDSKLPEIMENMKQEDILIITADHGNDPATPSTDHSREYVPILVYGKNLKQNINLGTRKTYADIASTILDMCDLEQLKYGESFKEEIIK